MVGEELLLLHHMPVVHLHAEVDVHLLQQGGEDLHVEGSRWLERNLANSLGDVQSRPEG